MMSTSHRADGFPFWPLVLLMVVGYAMWPHAASGQTESKLEGNWSVTWHDHPGPGKTTSALVVLARRWELISSPAAGGTTGFQAAPHQTDRKWYVQYTVDMRNWGRGYPEVDGQGTVTIKWGRESKLQSTGPNAMRGRWTERDKSGAEVWERVVPRVRQVVFKGASHYDYAADFAQYDDPASKTQTRWTGGGAPGRVEATYTDRWKPGEARGNLPKFKIQIEGDNMWGHHVVDLGGASDLEPLGRRYMQQGGGTVASVVDPRQVKGIELEVVIYARATPGRKVLRVDGVEIPFDFVVRNYPGAPADQTTAAPPKAGPKIFFARKTDGGFVRVTDKTLRYGDVFVVEVEMESESEQTVKLDWGAGKSSDVRVKKVPDNPRVLRSDLLRLDAPPAYPSAPPAPRPR
jgi:hypothetical protein